MTTMTRRYVWVSAVLLILLAPVAFLTWPAILGTDADAPKGWAAELSAQELDEASGSIDEYPLAYRRAIMRALTPEKRSAAWRAYITRYMSSHPNLNADTVRSIREASEFFTPQFFASRPSDDTLARLELVASRVRIQLGVPEAKRILVDLGPERVESVRWNAPSVVTFLRNRLTANAQYPHCVCALTSDYCGGDSHCATPPVLGCIVDDEWPMCGSGLWFPCNGLCYPNI